AVKQRGNSAKNPMPGALKLASLYKVAVCMESEFLQIQRKKQRQCAQCLFGSEWRWCDGPHFEQAGRFIFVSNLASASASVWCAPVLFRDLVRAYDASSLDSYKSDRKRAASLDGRRLFRIGGTTQCGCPVAVRAGALRHRADNPARSR